jgi:hypothetical protein
LVVCRVGLDLVGPLQKAPRGFTHLLVAIEKFSKWIEIRPLTSIGSEQAAAFFTNIIHRFGIPNSIITDNGTQFTGKKFLDFCEGHHIRVDWVAVAHPMTNGQVEHANGIILQGLNPRIYNDLNKFGKRWIKELPSVVWSLRTTPSRATGFSLFFLVYGVEAILPTNLEYGSPRTKAYDKQNNQTSQEDSLDQLEEAQDVALLYMCTFVLCLIGRPKAHNFWHGPDLARPNLIVGLGRHGPICGPCLGLKSSPWAGLARPI